MKGPKGVMSAKKHGLGKEGANQSLSMTVR